MPYVVSSWSTKGRVALVAPVTTWQAYNLYGGADFYNEGPNGRARKLSYKEQRELDELPKRIEALEAEQKELGEFLARPESYTAEPDRAMKAQLRHAKLDDELLAALERWELLGAK